MLNLELITEGGGYGIAITGMAIVFTGLLGISLFIALLPKVLAKLHALANPEAPPKAQAKNPAAASSNEAVLAAIAYVIDAERKWLLSDDVKALNLPQTSSWSLSDKMRTFPTRTNP